MNRFRVYAAYLAYLDLPILACFALASILSQRALPWAVAAGISFWFARWLAYGYFTVRTPADFGIIVLILMLPVTLWATSVPEKTSLQVCRLLLGVLLYYSIVNWSRTLLRIRWLVFGIVLASLLLALFAAVSVEWTYDKLLFIPYSVYEGFVLLVQDTVHRSVMAGSLVILLPIPLGLALFGWKELRPWERFTLILVALVVTGMLVLTQSRGALIALSVTMIAMVVLRWRRGWAIIPAAILAGFLARVIYNVDQIVDLLSSGVSLSGVESRVEVWSRAISMAEDFSITGIGMGAFQEVVDLLYPLYLELPGSVDHAHNLFLQVVVDLGIPGLIAWISILLVIIGLSWQIYRAGKKQGNGWMAGLGAGFFCSQLALATHGITDAVTWGMVRPAPLVWVIWGTISTIALFYLVPRAEHT
jgi:putative inorganic carbon (HCO3(-)) transporter